MSGAQKKKKVRPVCWAENGFIFDNTHSSVRAPPCRVASSYPGRPSADAATEPPPVPGRSSVSVSRGMFAAAAASVQGYDAQGSVTHACACAVGCSPDRAATRQLHVCAADVSVTIARARRRRRFPARRISTGAPLAARRLAPSGSPAGSPRGWEVRAGTRVRSSVPLYRHVSPPPPGGARVNHEIAIRTCRRWWRQKRVRHARAATDPNYCGTRLIKQPCIYRAGQSLRQTIRVWTIRSGRTTGKNSQSTERVSTKFVENKLTRSVLLLDGRWSVVVRRTIVFVDRCFGFDRILGPFWNFHGFKGPNF